MCMRTILKGLIGFIAVVVMTGTLYGMTPNAGADQIHCSHVHVAADEHHSHGFKAPNCCDTAHCCSILNQVPVPALPEAVQFHPQSVLKEERPLLLIQVIDPPPRTLAM